MNKTYLGMYIPLLLYKQKLMLMNNHICVHIYVCVRILYYTQFNFHKLVCYSCNPFNSRIYHMCCIKCGKISHVIFCEINTGLMMIQNPLINTSLQ